MTKVSTLESRIARIAEQYGDGLLRIYATEAGEMEKAYKHARSFGYRYFWALFNAVMGAVGFYIGSHLVGWL